MGVVPQANSLACGTDTALARQGTTDQTVRPFVKAVPCPHQHHTCIACLKVALALGAFGPTTAFPTTLATNDTCCLQPLSCHQHRHSLDSKWRCFDDCASVRLPSLTQTCHRPMHNCACAPPQAISGIHAHTHARTHAHMILSTSSPLFRTFCLQFTAWCPSAPISSAFVLAFIFWSLVGASVQQSL